MADKEGNVTLDEDDKILRGATQETHTSLENTDKDADNFPSFTDVMHVLKDIKANLSTEQESKLTDHLLTIQKMAERSEASQRESEESKKLLDALSSKRNEEKLNIVMAEYEKAIAKLVRENADLQKERDTFQVHLANVEAAFSDVHQKYERCKGIIEGFKNNETILRDTIRANEEHIAKQNNKYEALKTHAMGQLEKANSELVDLKKKYEDEIIRLKATLQKFELKNHSLAQALDQKTKECEELTRICDDLIAKVGR